MPGENPIAGNANLLASTATIIPGLKSSSTAIESAVTAVQADGTSGAGVAATAALIMASGSLFRTLSAASITGDAAGNNQLPSLVFNGTNWDRTRSVVTADGTSGTGIPAAGVMIRTSSSLYRPLVCAAVTTDAGGNDQLPAVVFNGTNWDRTRGGTDGTSLTGAARVIPVAKTFSNITTNTTTTVKNAAGIIAGLSINTAGTGSTVVLKDNATVIGTFDTTVVKSIELFDVFCTTSIVAVTAGAAAADITVFYR